MTSYPTPALWLGVTHKITSEHKKVMACSAGVPAQMFLV